MDIAKKIKEYGYINIFWQVDDTLLNELWANGNNRDELQKIWQNKAMGLQVRLTAAEILFQKDSLFPGTDQKIKILLTRLYINALNNNGTINGNIWGLPGFNGPAGENLFKTDKNESVRLLKLLLKNKQELNYVGSKDATYGNEYRYRVKDVAAFYLSKLLNVKYKIFKDLEDREIEIHHLTTRIEQ